MKRRSVLASMGAFTASGSLVMGSGAFTSAEVERDVDIDVVGDPYAFLGLRYPNEDGTYPPEDEPNGTPPETLSVNGETNLFRATHNFATNDPIETFSVKPSDDSSIDEENLDWEFWDDEEESDTFCSGCHANVMIDISDCNKGAKMNIEVEISAEGTGFSVSAEREFTIKCQNPSNGNSGATTAEFKGKSGQFRYEEGSVNETSLRAWYLDENDEIASIEPNKDPVKSPGKINLNNFGVQPPSIFAIEFISEGTFFIRETWESCSFGGGTTEAVELTQQDFCDKIEDCDSTSSPC
jgi:hypothetical protein